MYAAHNDGFHRLNFATGQWQSSPSPENSTLTGLVVGVDGVLGAVTKSRNEVGDVYTKMYLSRDVGAAWSELTVPFEAKLSAPAPVGGNRLITAAGRKLAANRCSRWPRRSLLANKNSRNFPVNSVSKYYAWLGALR